MSLVAVRAQDTRTVNEPVIPPVCTTLRAALQGPIAPADELKLDTERLQAALDHCAPGHAVELAADGAHDAFLSGPLELRAGVTLLIDKGVTLYGSRNPAVYATSPGSCGVVDDRRGGCRPLIHGEQVPHTAIMGDGVIDGRGGATMIDAQGQPQRETWWDLAQDARKGGHQQVPRLIIMDHSDDFTLYRITLKNSANFHVSYNFGNGFTVWGLKIDTPKNARNTDGVDPSASSNITVTHSYIRDGDDNIAIKGGAGPVTNMTVIHNHFYYGHGMSIGSETTRGVSKLRVTDLSLDGTDAGVRIKSAQSFGGLVHDVVYDDLCIRNSRTPIQLDMNYSANPSPVTGLFPVFLDIVLQNVRIEGGGKIVMNGFDTKHRIGVQLDGVMFLDDPAQYTYQVKHADVTLGPGPVNLVPVGEDSTLRGKAGKGTLAGCDAKFVPFPAE
jgi:polygalacturonase